MSKRRRPSLAHAGHASVYERQCHTGGTDTTAAAYYVHDIHHEGGLRRTTNPPLIRLCDMCFGVLDTKFHTTSYTPTRVSCGCTCLGWGLSDRRRQGSVTATRTHTKAGTSATRSVDPPPPSAAEHSPDKATATRWSYPPGGDAGQHRRVADLRSTAAHPRDNDPRNTTPSAGRASRHTATCHEAYLAGGVLSTIRRISPRPRPHRPTAHRHDAPITAEYKEAEHTTSKCHRTITRRDQPKPPCRRRSR